MIDQTSAQDVAQKIVKRLTQAIPGYLEFVSERTVAAQFIAAALKAERAQTIEECAKIMCHNCFKGTPFNADGQHIITEPSGNKYPRDCAAHEIRALVVHNTEGMKS
jgi:hypothetical protein